jgi:hypothetical protein
MVGIVREGELRQERPTETEARMLSTLRKRSIG